MGSNRCCGEIHHLEGQQAIEISEEPGVIYTIGHSTLSIEEFVALVERYAIQTVADVRRFPTSRKNPQYAQQALRTALHSVGMDYIWLGDGLGGYRTGGYETFMHTTAFQRGITRLEALAKEATTVIMCAEKLSIRCHRRFIANALAIRGWRVLHIIDDSTPSIHTLQPTLF